MHFVTPIPQDPSYHAFADLSRVLAFQTSVMWHRISASHSWGLGAIESSRVREGDIFTDRIDASPYILFFAGVASIVGSVYYHIDPNNAGLFWIGCQ